MYAIMGSALVYSCYTDFKERKIKNYVTFPLMLLGLIFNLIADGWEGVFFSVKGMLLIGFAGLILAVLGGMGMGDVKLFMAIGAFFGAPFALDTFAFSSLLFILSFILLRPKRIFRAFRNIYRAILVSKTLKAKPSISEKESAFVFPYAIFISIGFVISVFTGGEWVWSMYS